MGHPADLSECSRPKGRAVALGVDVGADGMTAVVSDGRGRVVRSLERPVPEDCRSDGRRLAEEIGGAVASLCASAVDELADEGKDRTAQAPVLIVGVCVPGVVDEDRGQICRSAVLGLQDVPLASHVSRFLPVPAESAKVLLYQDARCGAWAESRWGAGGASCLYLSIGKSITSAVLLDGVPAPGGDRAGQVGQVLVSDPDWSGERARLEDVASVDAMVGRYTAGIVDDSAASLNSSDGFSTGGTGSSASGLEPLLSAMRSGDREARRVWDTGLDTLADLIARGAGLLGPLDVVVSSELTRAGEAVFLEPLRGRVADLMAGLPAPSLLSAQLGKTGSALGASGRALEDWQ